MLNTQKIQFITFLLNLDTSTKHIHFVYRTNG